MELYDPKNPENLSYIDPFRTNKNIRFLDTNVFETGLSNFHKLVVTVLFQKNETTKDIEDKKVLTILNLDQL